MQAHSSFFPCKSVGLAFDLQPGKRRERGFNFFILQYTYFITIIPLVVAASQSILSTPVPARPMIFRFLPAFMTSAVTLVADLTISPSYFCITKTK